MIAFWMAAVAMLLLGYIFFLPALFGKSRTRGTNRARLNLLLHQQRQRELADEAMAPEERERLAAESERNLLGDLESASGQATQPATAGRLLLGMTLLALPAFAMIAYLALGRPELIGHVASSAQQMPDLDSSIQKLAERLKQNPNDIQGWVLMGRSLQATQKPDRAATAYEYAVKLAPEDLDIKALYAESLAEANQGSIEGKPREIIEDILKKNPNHKGGLWMAGLAAAQRKDADKAVEYWHQLQAQFPPGSDDARELGRYIAKIQGLPVEPEPAPAASSGGGKRIRVKVTLAQSLKAKAAPGDALFVFARAAEGPPMPLAVVRKQVKDLPIEVVLDDSMSMMQGMNLSSFERIVVGARVSKSGRPTPTPGDLQGLTAPVTPDNEASYSVTVDQVVGGGS